MIDVPFFRNGEDENNPPWVMAWGEKEPPSGKAKLPAPYGGDLQGLREKIPYLKDLGVNALILCSVFTAPPKVSTHDVPLGQRFQHVDNGIAVPPVQPTDPDPSDPVYTPSDRLFLEVVRDLHRAGFKVIVVLERLPAAFTPADPAPVAADLIAITKRWLTPLAEDLPPDGIDGFLVAHPQGDPAGFWTEWRKQMHAIKPDAALIASVVDSPKEWVHLGPFDTAIDLTQSAAIHRFFLEPHEPPDPNEPRAQGEQNRAAATSAPATNRAARLLAEISVSQVAPHSEMPAGLLTYQMHREIVRGLDRALRSVARALPFRGAPESHDAESERESPTPDLDQIRLAYVFQAFAPGTPLLFQGEEVTFHIVEHLDHWLPMPWLDLPPPAVPPREYRGDLLALIRNLNLMRERYAPLRRGGFQPLLADDERKLLAFARTLPGDKVILVINHGAENQRVTLPCAKPGQLVAVLTPQLRPLPVRSAPDQPPALPDPATVKDLRVGGGRQFADADGNVSFWVDSMGARVVLVNDVEPRRDRP